MACTNIPDTCCGAALWLTVLLSLCLSGKHWSCLQPLSQTSGRSQPDGGQGTQSEKDEAETVSAMASLSVDVEQPVSVPESTDSSR